MNAPAGTLLSDLNSENWSEKLEHAISTTLYTLKLAVTLKTCGGYKVEGYPIMTEWAFVRWVREQEHKQ